MKLGFLTAPFPDTPLMEVADWAAANGFEVSEIACWPKRPADTGATPASHIDVVHITDGQAQDIRGEIEGKGLAISGLGFYEPAPPPIPTIGTRSSGTSST